MRAAAQVGELADGVRGDDGVLRQLGDELQLERLAREDLLGLGARDHATLEGFVGLHDLGHAGLDGGKVVRRQRAVELHVVVETVLDGRPHTELHVAVEVDERGGHDVRGGVAQKLQPLVALGRDDGNRVAFGHGGRQINRLVVHDARERGLRQAGADGRGHVGDGGAVCELLVRAVGKYDVHICSFPVPGAHKAPARSVRSERALRPPLRQNNEAAPLFARRLRLHCEVVTARRARTERGAPASSAAGSPPAAGHDACADHRQRAWRSTGTRSRWGRARGCRCRKGS